MNEHERYAVVGILSTSMRRDARDHTDTQAFTNTYNVWRGLGKAEGWNVLLCRRCLFSRNFSKSFVHNAKHAA